MKNKKIAIIFEGHSENPKGQFNAVIERIKHLKAYASLGGYVCNTNIRWLSF